MIKHLKSSKNKYKNGVALIMVLSVIFVATTLIISYLSLSKSEVVVTDAYVSSTLSKKLSENAVNLVIGQIRQATKDSNKQWVSQPGAIRQYSDDGTFSSGFKLYSDDKMVVNESEESFAFDDFKELKEWSKNPDIWVDLNEPVIRDEFVHFPIVDPLAKTKQSIKGFDYDLTDVPVLGDLEDKLKELEVEELPMPVKWIYFREDGVMGYLSEDNKFLPFDEKDKVDESLDLVSRIAFWADDESSKVNINTASEPVFWDTPKANGSSPGDTPLGDLWYAHSIPSSSEYQRIPGHPAQTALSPILAPDKKYRMNSKYDELIYNLVPRISVGGSNSGKRTGLNEDFLVDNDRLFSSIDEMIFSIKKDAGSNLLKWREESDLLYDKALKDDKKEKESLLRRSSFFLTTNSKSPELNLFNKPRISMWPISFEEKDDKGRDKLSVFDRAIKIASIINKNDNQKDIYYFQRLNSYSATDDWDNIERNQEIMSYLQHLTSLEIPGYGNSFVDKYPKDRDQILTQIFDYIRCTNIYDLSLGETFKGLYQENYNEWKSGQSQPQFTVGLNSTEDGSFPEGIQGKKYRSPIPSQGQVTPIQINSNNTKGFGRFVTLSELGIQFICNADEAYNESNDVNNNKALTRILTTGEKSIQAAFLFELFNPSMGYPILREDMSIEMTIIQDFQLNGKTLEFPSSMTWNSSPIENKGITRSMWGGGHAEQYNLGGIIPFWTLMGNRTVGSRGNIPEDKDFNENDSYPFVSVPLIIDNTTNNGKMTVSEGVVEIKIYSGNNNSPYPKQLSQTFKLVFPAVTLKTPELFKEEEFIISNWDPQHYMKRSGKPVTDFFGEKSEDISQWSDYTSVRLTDPAFFWSFNRYGIKPETYGRFSSYNSKTAFIRNRDVVRSIAPRHGDYRHVLAKKIIDDQFSPENQRLFIRSSNNYENSDHYSNHSFSSIEGDKIIPNNDYHKRPPLPSGIDVSKDWYLHDQPRPDVPYSASISSSYRDFDNGIGRFKDGAYINKPDEGVVSFQEGSFNFVSGESEDQWKNVPYVNQVYKLEKNSFSPNRQVSSPVMLGSLPTGIKSDVPWQTLLFRPQKDHNGEKNPPDHIFLDLFWMPVVEPYAISNNLATSGKINLNYQMLPFNHITRATGIHSVMKSEYMLIIPNYHSDKYKTHMTVSNGMRRARLPDGVYLRRPINIDETLKQFKEKFAGGEVFKTASEICNIHLVPNKKEDTRQVDENGNKIGPDPVSEDSSNSNITLEDMKGDFWDNHAFTGDNSRERPYANIYPRVSTKSNVYRVHYRCQIISPKKRRENDTSARKFIVKSDYRGSSLIERYLDSENNNIPDYAKNPDSDKGLNSFYKFKIINSKRFAP